LQPKYRDITGKHGCLSYNEAMNLWQDTHDAKAIFNKFHWKNGNEGMLLKELSMNPKNFNGALLSLPRNHRNMYLHAYQSLLWNLVASDRIKTHGLKVLPGDLILFDHEDTPEEVSDDEKLIKKPVYATGDILEKASIYDVVIPLPGSKVIMPQNSTGDKMRELLEKDGLDITFSATNDLKQWTFYGDYRKLVVKPKSLSWKKLSYSSDESRLVQSDLETLKGVAMTLEEGTKIAIKLNVSLPSSTYATVFARELTKKDFASCWIAKLDNDDIKEDAKQKGDVDSPGQDVDSPGQDIDSPGQDVLLLSKAT